MNVWWWIVSIILYVAVADPKITIWNPVAKSSVSIDPSQQHVPVDFPELIEKRPPRPLMPKHRSPTIFIGIAAFRDGKRCGNTLYTAFSNAEDASRVYIGVVDQAMGDDVLCLDEYCKLAAEKGYIDLPGSDEIHKDCPHLHQIRIMSKDAKESKGPTTARSWQQKLLHDEDFCLQVDAHSMFMESWDSVLIDDWLRAGNEMAILSTYITDYNTRKTWPKNQHPHLCRAITGGNGLVRNDGASIAGNIVKPQLSCFWGAGLSFGKCHSERRVPLDPFSYWVFDGEEFIKASRLWTNGYDIYTPKSFAIYHDYTQVPHRFEAVPLDKEIKVKEKEMGVNRVKLVLNMPFEGPVKSDDIDNYRMGSVRSFDSYLNFSGVHLENRAKDENRCRQLHWTPYENIQVVKEIVSDQLKKDWMFYPPYEPGTRNEYQDKSRSMMRRAATTISTTTTIRTGMDNGSLYLLASGTVLTSLIVMMKKYVKRNKKQEYKHY